MTEEQNKITPEEEAAEQVEEAVEEPIRGKKVEVTIVEEASTTAEEAVVSDALYEGEEDTPYNLIEPRGAAALVTIIFVGYIVYYILIYFEIFIQRGG